MTNIKIAEAKKYLYDLVDAVHESHESLLVKGRHHNAVLLSEDDYLTMKETLYLVSEHLEFDTV